MVCCAYCSERAGVAAVSAIPAEPSVTTSEAFACAGGLHWCSSHAARGTAAKETRDVSNS